MYKLIDTLFLIFVTGGISTLFSNLNLNFISTISNYILGVLYIFMIFRLSRSKLKLNKVAATYVYLFIIFLVMNMLFSQNINSSVKAITYLTLNILYAYYLHNQYSLKEVIKLISFALGIISILSSLLCIMMPDKFTYFDTLYIKTVWKGIFSHKNTLGNISAFTILILFLNLRFDKTKKNKVFSILIIIISSINLYFSESHTPVYALIICVIYALSKKILKKEIAFLVFLSVLIINYMYIFQFDLVNEIFRKYSFDLSVSGRREVFNVLLDLGSRKPFLGYGLGSFWVENGYTYNHVYNYLGFNPNTSHNAFIELFVNIGIIGLSVYVGILFMTFKNSIIKYRKKQISNSLIILMVFLLIMSIFESTLAVSVNIYWVIQFYIFFQMSSSDENIKS